MRTAEQNTVSSKTSVFGLLDEAPMTPLHYCYWLLASGGTVKVALPAERGRMTVANQELAPAR